MVVDTAESLLAPTNTVTDTMDSMPPTYPYIARAALMHIGNGPQREDDGWSRNADGVLQTSLDKYSQRWDVNISD